MSTQITAILEIAKAMATINTVSYGKVEYSYVKEGVAVESKVSVTNLPSLKENLLNPNTSTIEISSIKLFTEAGDTCNVYIKVYGLDVNINGHQFTVVIPPYENILELDSWRVYVTETTLWESKTRSFMSKPNQEDFIKTVSETVFNMIMWAKYGIYSEALNNFNGK